MLGERSYLPVEFFVMTSFLVQLGLRRQERCFEKRLRFTDDPNALTAVGIGVEARNIPEVAVEKCGFSSFWA